MHPQSAPKETDRTDGLALIASEPSSSIPDSGAGGSISGRVVDPLGAAVQDALVTMENQATGEVRSLKTNERGFYNFPNLAPGRYNAVVSHVGFGDFTKKDLVVVAGGQLRVDFEITVGTVANSVEVRGGCLTGPNHSGVSYRPKCLDAQHSHRKFR